MHETPQELVDKHVILIYLMMMITVMRMLIYYLLMYHLLMYHLLKLEEEVEVLEVVEDPEEVVVVGELEKIPPLLKHR